MLAGGTLPGENSPRISLSVGENSASRFPPGRSLLRGDTISRKSARGMNFEEIS